jgi:hypothetical protein
MGSQCYKCCRYNLKGRLECKTVYVNTKLKLWSVPAGCCSGIWRNAVLLCSQWSLEHVLVVPVYSAGVVVPCGGLMLRWMQQGVAEVHHRRCCIRLKTEKMVDGGLSSRVVSRVQLGDSCVANVRGLLFTVLYLHWLCVEIVLGSEYIVTVGFWLLVGMRCRQPGVFTAVCPVWW